MRPLHDYFVSMSFVVRGLLEIIYRRAVQISLVKESDRSTVGVTGGAGYQGLLRGEKLDLPVTTIMRWNFRSLPFSASAVEA